MKTAWKYNSGSSGSNPKIIMTSVRCWNFCVSSLLWCVCYLQAWPHISDFACVTLFCCRLHTLWLWPTEALLIDHAAHLNPKTPTPIPNCHPCTGNPNSETPRDSKNAFLTCGDAWEIPSHFLPCFAGCQPSWSLQFGAPPWQEWQAHCWQTLHSGSRRGT